MESPSAHRPIDSFHVVHVHHPPIHSILFVCVQTFLLSTTRVPVQYTCTPSTRSIFFCIFHQSRRADRRYNRAQQRNLKFFFILQNPYYIQYHVVPHVSSSHHPHHATLSHSTVVNRYRGTVLYCIYFGFGFDAKKDAAVCLCEANNNKQKNKK